MPDVNAFLGVRVLVRVHCRFVLKTDDDAFVNMFSLMRRLHKLDTTDDETSSESSRMLLMCNVWHEASVMRGGKNGIERSTWRYEYWPTFCQGVAFIMTANFVESAYRLVHRVPRLWLDDVLHCDFFVQLFLRNYMLANPTTTQLMHKKGVIATL